jgi:hypothetical protein
MQVPLEVDEHIYPAALDGSDSLGHIALCITAKILSAFISVEGNDYFKSKNLNLLICDFLYWIFSLCIPTR